MAGAYSVIGLIFCIRLVVQSEIRPLILATCYSLGHAVIWPLLGIHWAAGVISAVVSFGLTYLYLRGLETLESWRFWVLLPLGALVVALTNFSAQQICALFGIEI